MSLSTHRKKKPVVVMTLIVVASFSLIFNALGAFSALASLQSHGILATIGTVVLNALAALFCGLMIGSLANDRFTTRTPISAYLWFMLLLYPFSNIAREFGLYTPRPHLENTQLMGAFVAELFRYALFIGLIVWTAISKALRKYLSPDSGRPPPLPE